MPSDFTQITGKMALNEYLFHLKAAKSQNTHDFYRGSLAEYKLHNVLNLARNI